jgi:hypothetical protein
MQLLFWLVIAYASRDVAFAHTPQLGDKNNKILRNGYYYLQKNEKMLPISLRFDNLDAKNRIQT